MRKKIRDINWLIKYHIDFFKEFGIEENNLVDYYEEWNANRGYSSIYDFAWSILNNILNEISIQSTTQEQIFRLNIKTYSKMWEILADENKNWNHVKSVLHENELMLWKLNEVYKQQVQIISGYCCEFCNSLNGKKMSIDEALDKQYLASSNCTREVGCNCCYSIRSVRGEDGRLILANQKK